MLTDASGQQCLPAAGKTIVGRSSSTSICFDATLQRDTFRLLASLSSVQRPIAQYPPASTVAIVTRLCDERDVVVI